MSSDIFKVHVNKNCRVPIFLIIVLLLTGCDIFTSEQSLRLALPHNDYSYNYSLKHLVSVLEVGGYNVEIIPTKNAIEANILVAQGKPT
ncbi:MAG: hypothetical protein ACI9T9_001452 [Oleiphilaceae bacterium]|jgi:hypothetical protein